MLSKKRRKVTVDLTTIQKINPKSNQKIAEAQIFIKKFVLLYIIIFLICVSNVILYKKKKINKQSLTNKYILAKKLNKRTFKKLKCKKWILTYIKS